MGLTCWYPVRVCMRRWKSSGIKSRDGSPIVSSPLLPLYLRRKPAYPPFRLLSLTSTGWQHFGWSALPPPRTQQRLALALTSHPCLSTGRLIPTGPSVHGSPPTLCPYPGGLNGPSKVRSHLPVDQLANIALPLLGTLTWALLAKAHLLPNVSRLPRPDTMKAAYCALQGRARSLLLEDWKKVAPTPTYYTFPLSLTPHPFMGLGRFVAGRIHQMRAQKSYLAAYPSWSRVLEPRHCPRCGDEDETFSHAILCCPSTANKRERLLQGLSDVGPESPL